jgi:hypothetical protein
MYEVFDMTDSTQSACPKSLLLLKPTTTNRDDIKPTVLLLYTTTLYFTVHRGELLFSFLFSPSRRDEDIGTWLWWQNLYLSHLSRGPEPPLTFANNVL